MTTRAAAFVALALTVAVSSQSLAQPQVVSVGGTWQHLGSATIAGTGFGVKTPAAPYKWDNFDSGTPGTFIGGGWHTEAFQSAKKPTYSTTRIRYPGSQSCFQNFTGGNYNSTIGLTNLNVGRMYVSGWYYNTTQGAPSRNFKLVSFRGGAPGEWTFPNMRSDMYPVNGSGHLYVADCAGSTMSNNWGLGGDIMSGAWHRVESWMDHGTPNGSNGLATMWRDAQPWASISGTFMTTNCPFTNLYISSYFATDEGTPTPECEWYWDELYIDITRARVEIGNAPTWAACTHREVQIPTAWSSTSVSITVNRGSFLGGQTAYVYVVDANGVQNTTGQAITFSDVVIPDSPPTVTILQPTSAPTYTATSSLLAIAGNASDDLGLALITWDTSMGGGGQAVNNSGDWHSWSVPAINLAAGTNVITVFAMDSTGHSASDTLTVFFNDQGAPGEPGQPIRGQ